MLFKSSNKIQIDCYTYRQDVYDYARPAESKHFIPEWWKSLDNVIHQQGQFAPSATMKHCKGFLDQFTSGFMVPMWTDLLFETDRVGNPNYRWEFADGMSKGVVHEQMLRGGFLNQNEYSHLKIIVPWVIECSKPDVKWILQQPTWNMKNIPYVIPSGIVTFEHQHSCHTNIFGIKKENASSKFMIEAGQPLVQLIPMSMDKIEIRSHVVSKEEYDRRSSSSVQTSFMKKYATHIRLKEFYENIRSS